MVNLTSFAFYHIFFEPSLRNHPTRTPPFSWGCFRTLFRTPFVFSYLSVARTWDALNTVSTMQWQSTLNNSSGSWPPWVLIIMIRYLWVPVHQGSFLQLAICFYLSTYDINDGSRPRISQFEILDLVPDVVLKDLLSLPSNFLQFRTHLHQILGLIKDIWRLLQSADARQHVITAYLR